MPLTEFICPDNVRIKIGDCLEEGGCRMGDRCATRSYLRMAGADRPWTGRPSTTQLIGGTMLAFLKITKDYATAPDSRAFMVTGTRGHAVLESNDDNLSLLEERFHDKDDDVTGIADVLEVEDGVITLVDSKCSGSFKVAKALGFTTVKEPTGEFYKSGKRKGEEKTRNILKRDMSAVDRREWELQLNKYRMAFERRGFKADRLKIMCVVRDGGTYIARQRGVFRNIYYFNIDILPDTEVNEYFGKKKEALLTALERGHQDDVCTSEENWDGLRCQSYCDVAEYCKYGKYLLKEREESDVIKGLSEIRRLPRLGSIRLGIKKKTKSGKEYPAEIDYFRLDPSTPSELENEKLVQEFETLFGKKPKSIDIMFPVPDPEIFFKQDYKRYGSGTSLKCKGDGEFASCAIAEYAEGLEIVGEDEMGMTKVRCDGRECPYYKKKACSEVGILQVLIPDLPGAGVWQIATGSFHSIVSLNSSIAHVKAICGRVNMIPLKLERVPQETTYEGKKATHYILRINQSMRLSDMQKFAQIEPTKALLSLPEVEPESSDLLFRENAVIDIEPEKEDVETEKKSEEPTPEPAAEEPAAEAPRKSEPEGDSNEPISPLQKRAIEKGLARKKLMPDDYLEWIAYNAKIKVSSIDNLTKTQAAKVIVTINKRR